MKILLCAILSLPLILFGVENTTNADSTETTKPTNIKLFQTDSTKSEKSKKIRPKGLKTKEPDGFMFGIGNVFGGVIGTTPQYNNYFNVVDLETSRVTPLSGVELLLGYKWFFGEKGVFGMRLYGRYEFLYELSAMTNHGSLNYDLLFNFNQNQAFKAGMILGILVGGGRTDYLWDSREVTKDYGGGTYTTYEDVYFNNTYDTKFSVGLNIGFRFVIFDRSAIEILFQPQFNIRDKFVYEGFNLHENRDISLGNEISLLGMTRFIYTF